MSISEPKSDAPLTSRKGYEPPVATSVSGWRYHHIGIPTDVQRPGEIHLERFKMYVSALETSPCGIQWMRFEPDSPVHALVKRPRVRADFSSSLEELSRVSSVHEATCTSDFVHGLRERRIQPNAHQWALREDYRRGTLQRHKLKRC